MMKTSFYFIALAATVISATTLVGASAISIVSATTTRSTATPISADVESNAIIARCVDPTGVCCPGGPGC
ncbi:hypothetical protein PQX77_005552 [Marasmius sp. AFHP31]|nr:hypothetical protein PQX77_005552 [Marasmius sp. AFHP31]